MNRLKFFLYPVQPCVLAVGCLVCSGLAALQGASSGRLDLRDRLSDAHALGADYWIYNDFEKAKEAARRTNKPIFVTFRCVPCAACKGFDAEVAKGSELIKTLAMTHFVPLRQVEMKGVDLNEFEFDYDLNWAAMFVNADGTVYGRYGTQSAEGPDAYNSIESLEKAMMRVLDLHRNYPRNKASLAGKRGKPKPYHTALEMPGLEQRERLRGRTEVGNCVHCHNIHDAQNVQAQRSGTFSRDLLWRYPLPDNVGVHIDPKDGRRVARVFEGSAAARAGIRVDDVVTRVEGQPIISIADIQWVLHHLPNTNAAVRFTVERDGHSMDTLLVMYPGWKKTDISWRGSLWSVSPRLRMWAPALSSEERKARGIGEGRKAMRIQWLNRKEAGGRAAYEAGLREGDVIVGVGGKPIESTEARFHLFVKLHYEVGQRLPLTVLRKGKRMEFEIPLVE